MANILLINSILKKWSGCFEKGLAIGIIELSYHDFLIPLAHILLPSVYRTKKNTGLPRVNFKVFYLFNSSLFLTGGQWVETHQIYQPISAWLSVFIISVISHFI